MTAVDPWAVVRAAQAGDQDAFAELYTTYRRRVRAFVLSQLSWHQFELADDLTADTFLKALRRLDSLTDHTRTDPMAWLITIARNLVYDHRKCSNARLTIPAAYTPEPREHIDSAAVTWETSEARAAVAATVHRCLAELIPNQREAVVRYWLTTDQESTSTAVRQVRGRGMRAMRASLAGQGITSSRDVAA